MIRGLLRPVARDEAFWRGLMLVGVDPAAAEAAFRSLAQSRPKAMHPKGRPSKPVPIVFDVARDADHILYKADADTHGRLAPMSKRPQDFQSERAERVPWIAEVLALPDAIYSDKREPERFTYLCWTLAGEQFAVVVENRPGKAEKSFVTAFVIDPEQWRRKRLGFKKTYTK